MISRLFRKVKREKPGRFYIQPAYTQAAAEFLVGTVKSSHAEQCDAARMVSVLKAVTVILTVGTMANFVLCVFKHNTSTLYSILKQNTFLEVRLLN